MGVEIVTKEDLVEFQLAMMAELAKLVQGIADLASILNDLKKEIPSRATITSGYIPAMEYMRAVGIKRWKFDRLIADNKIRAVKKKRKIYVPVGEVERYFKDPNIR